VGEQSAPATVDELLQRIRLARAELDQTIGGRPDSEMTLRPDGGWSVKDHLAHLDTWHHILLDALDGRPHEAVGLDRDRFEQLGLDELNAVIDSANRDRSLAEVRHAFASSYDEVVDRIAGLGDADLLAPVYADDPRPRLNKIIGDTYGHYAEHQTWIAALVAAARP
jgi:hypothetical protein